MCSPLAGPIAEFCLRGHRRICSAARGAWANQWPNHDDGRENRRRSTRPSYPALRFRRRDGSGTDLLIRNRRLGQALANSLASSNAVLMRGHGSTVVAPSLERAVYRAVYTEVNAKILADALRIGSVEYLSLEDAGEVLTGQARSKMAAIPWPPPIHIVTNA